jgi:ATP-binding cassette subfamily B protein
MKYTLTNTSPEQDLNPTMGIRTAVKKLWPLLKPETGRMLIALLAILANAGLTIWAPILTGHAVDRYLLHRDYHGVLVYTGYILLTFIGVLITGFISTRTMGVVGQQLLFRLRNLIFGKLQELPVSFFNQNKGGDLISRINNDTDKLNMFFSRSLMQFVSNAFVVLGAGIAMVVVNHKLGTAALVPALILFFIIQLTTAWVKRKNLANLQTIGGMSAEISESLQNFRVIVAFNRQDYFRDKFQEVNEANYKTAVGAGVANNTYVPIFGFASNLGQMIVIIYGLYLITHGAFSFGLLISYLAYVTRFYDPLRQMASLWSDLQTALAAWERIGEILSLKSDLNQVEVVGDTPADAPVMEFKHVGFAYPEGVQVLNDINFKMEPGKTYALVGPTGGGKTTTASLIARLFDPTTGEVFLEGRDIRSYTAEERSKKIGFILQDPFLFSGTVKENILYGNDEYHKLSDKDLEELFKKEGLTDLLNRFDEGLKTKITSASDGISLGQKQLIAFMRAVLRHPDILILDEATANIDTVTEQLLDTILKQLSKKTTRIVIAHRLNTIENADEIFFVNGGAVTPAGSLEHAVEMLSQGARAS